MAVDSTIQFKRGKKNDLPYGLEGEPLYCTDTNELYVGQGKDLPPKLINANGTGGSGGGTGGGEVTVDFSNYYKKVKLIVKVRLIRN